MAQQRQSGSIEVICGSMFSGKTEELLRRIRRAQIGRQEVQVFKPKIDNRYSEKHVQSHNATRTLSIPVSSSWDILEHVGDRTRVVGIDEVQFFDMDVVQVAQKLADRGIQVICAGLDMDFKAEPFGPMPLLLCLAEEVTKLSAICIVCGGLASRTQRLISDADEQVMVGAGETYEARCRFCHDVNPVVVEPNPTGLTSSTPPSPKERTHEHSAS